MMRAATFQKAFFTIPFLLLFVQRADAQASLAAENIIDQVSVKSPGENGIDVTNKFTVIRDALNAEQWYYVPNEPRVVLVGTDIGSAPEFTLLRYATRDSQDAQKFNGGGLINFAVTLSAPDGAVEQMKESIRGTLKSAGKPVPQDIRLSALPFKSASANIYSPKGDQLNSEPLGTGPSALFATQKMVFSVPVTELGSDVYDALVHSTTGIPVAIRFTFTGLTPPAGFTVDVNWDRAYDFYSRNSEFRAHASYYGLFGAGGGYSSTDIREKLVDSKAIKINIIEGEGLTLDKIDAYLQPILKRINDELLEQFKPPPHIDPAVAPSVSAGGYFASASYSVAVKNVSLIKHGTETIDFRYSKHVDRDTVASGFVGIGLFPADVQKKLVVVVDNSTWINAYVPLPPVPKSVDKVNMDIRLTARDRIFDAQNLSFNRADGWRDEQNHVVDRISFNLLKLRKDLGDEGVKAARYNIDYTLQANGDTMAAKLELPVVENGSISIAPTRLVDTVTIDPGGLPWKVLSDEKKGATGTLTRVSISLASGDQSINFTFRPALVEGRYMEPPPISWVIRRSSVGVPSKVGGSVEFRDQGGTRKWLFDDLSKSSNDFSLFLDEKLADAH
jgi:hypothetical protein